MSRENEIPETPAVRTWYVGAEDGDETKDSNYASPKDQLMDDALVVGQDVEEIGNLNSTDAIAGQIDPSEPIFQAEDTLDIDDTVMAQPREEKVIKLEDAALDAEQADPIFEPVEDLAADQPTGQNSQLSEEQQADQEADTLRSSIFPKLKAEEPEASSSGQHIKGAPGPQAQPDAEVSGEEPIENTATRRLGILRGKPEAAPEEDTPNWSDLEEVDAPKPRAERESARRRELEETIFEGATVKPTVPSRWAAHLWSLLLTLLLAPVTWYLLMDGGTRMMNPESSAWAMNSGPKSAHLSEFLAGAVLLFVIVWMGRFSSLGVFFSGIVLTVMGAPFVFLPGQTHAQLSGFLATLQAAGESGHFYQAVPANVAHHIETSGPSGLLLAAGLAFMAIGLVSHGARRKGRKDFQVHKKVQQAAQKH